MSYFSDDEFSVIAQGVKQAGRMGFPYTESSLRSLLEDAVRALEYKLNLESPVGIQK